MSHNFVSYQNFPASRYLREIIFDNLKEKRDVVPNKVKIIWRYIV